MNSGVKGLFWILGLGATILSVMAIYDAQPDTVLKFLYGLKYVGIGVGCLIVVVAIIAAIGKKPALLIYLVVLGACVGGVVYVTGQVMPKTDRWTLLILGSVAGVIGMVISGILANAMAGDD